MSIITAEYFEEAVGRPPKDDDLIRCNCTEKGDFGHMCCGWNYQKNLPVFIAGPESRSIQSEDELKTYPPDYEPVDPMSVK